MALPNLDKTWQFNVNNALSTFAAVLYTLKAALTGFASSPWTVVRSSNGTLAGASDYWASASDVIWANPGVAHSWIVLKQTGVASNFQILLETKKDGGGGSTSFNFFVSPVAGFTGGSTTTAPTATDQIDLDNAATLTVSNDSTPVRLHVMQSSDGECTRWIINYDQFTPHLVVIDKPKSPLVAWTLPWVIIAPVQTYNSGSTTNWCTYAKLNDVSTYTFGEIGSDEVHLYLTSEMYNTAMIGENLTVPDDQTGEWPLAPIGLACTVAGHRGVRKGILYDLWWGSTGVPTGYSYPDDGSYQFVQFRDLILPWSGAEPILV